MRTIRMVDMYCGGGGTTTGALRACNRANVRADLLGINHWGTAVETFRLNHPYARSLCEDVDRVRPKEAVPSGRVDLMVASPECTYFSTARGAATVTEQGRADAWQVVRWATDLDITNILVENVKEFLDWGPVSKKTGRPLKSKKKTYFTAWVEALRALGYNVEHRILMAANYGDPTSRERAFIQARKGRLITWPEHTHAPRANGKKAWRTAREIINWEHPSYSIFLSNEDARKHKVRIRRPLSDATLRRIAYGLEKFCGEEAKPFLTILQGRSMARGLDEPVPTVMAGARKLGLVEPFFLSLRGTGRSRSIDRPLPTVTAQGKHVGLVQPMIMPIDQARSDKQGQSIDRPLSTVITKQRHCLVQPVVVSVNHGGDEDRSRSLDDPLATVTRTRGQGLVMPVELDGTDFSSVDPFLTMYYGQSKAAAIDDPLGTVTTRDRFGLCSPIQTQDGRMFDILFRMLENDELAAAQGFPDWYQFAGTRKADITAQIGNAVPGGMAEALVFNIVKEFS